MRKNLIFSNRSTRLSHLCRTTTIEYTNVFAVPLVDGLEANGSALSDFQSFFPTVGDNCTPYMGPGVIHAPNILDPVSALTITRTSFGSLARSTTANPSPSATAENPVILATTPVHSQNDLATPHSDNASPKPTASQILQPVSDSPPSNPIPSQISQSALDSPPLPVSITVSMPQSAGPKRPSIQHNANKPGKFHSTL